MANKGLDLDGLRNLRGAAFAPIVQQLEIEPVTIHEAGVTFEIPATELILRTGDIVCGQALASIADTVGVMALFAHNEEQRIMTTVDMTNHFLRPLVKGVLVADAVILSNGRRMASVRVDICQKGSNKVAGASTCAYVYV